MSAQNRPSAHGSDHNAMMCDERTLALENMPSSDFHDMLRSVQMDADWLEAAMAMGRFDFSIESAFDADSTPALDALDIVLDFPKSCSTETFNLEPFQGYRENPLSIAHFSTQPSAKNFYPHFVAHLLAQYQASRASLLAMDSKPIDEQERGAQTFQRIEKMIGRLLIGACVLDLPQTVRAIVSMVPQAACSGHPMGAFGQVLRFNEPKKMAGESVEGWEFTPSFFAMQLGRLACVQAIQEAMGQDSLPFALFTELEIEGETSRPTPKEMDLIDVLAVITPMCAPQVFTTILEHRLSDLRPASMGGPNLQKLHARAVNTFIQTGKCQGSRAFIPCYMACHAYEIDPTQSIRQAILYAVPQVVHSISGKVDWVKIFLPDPERKHSIMKLGLMTGMLFNNREKERDHAMAIAIEKAVMDGKKDLALRSTLEDNLSTGAESSEKFGDQVAQPMGMMINENYQKSIIALLKSGLNVHDSLHPGLPSLLAMAEAVNPEMAHLMHAFETRKKSMALLDEMDLTNILGDPLAPVYLASAP